MNREQHAIQVDIHNNIITIEDIDTTQERWINRGEPINLFLPEGYHLKLYYIRNNNYINEILTSAFDTMIYGDMLITINSRSGKDTLNDYKLLFKIMNKNINKVRFEIMEILENEKIKENLLR